MKLEWLKEIPGYPLKTEDLRIFYYDWNPAKNSSQLRKAYAAGVKNPSNKQFFGDTIYRPIGSEDNGQWEIMGGFKTVLKACDYYEQHGKWPDEI